MNFTAESLPTFKRALDHAIMADPRAWPNPHLYALEVDGGVVFGANDRDRVPAGVYFSIPADRISVSRMTNMKNPRAGITSLAHYENIQMAMCVGWADEKGGLAPATEEAARLYARDCLFNLSRDGYGLEDALRETERTFTLEGQAGFTIEDGTIIVPSLHTSDFWKFSVRELVTATKAQITDEVCVPRNVSTAQVYAAKRLREMLAGGKPIAAAYRRASDPIPHRPLYADFQIGDGYVYVEDERASRTNGWHFAVADLEYDLLAARQGIAIAVEADCRRRFGLAQDAAGVKRRDLPSTPRPQYFKVGIAGAWPKYSPTISARDADEAARAFVAIGISEAECEPGAKWPLCVYEADTQTLVGRYEAVVNAERKIEVSAGHSVQEPDREETAAVEVRGDAILITEPHGAQTLRPLGPDEQDNDGNRLYELADADGKNLVFTGEELSSLAGQWLQYRQDRAAALAQSAQPPAERARLDLEESQRRSSRQQQFRVCDEDSEETVTAIDAEAAVQRFVEGYDTAALRGADHCWCVRVFDAERKPVGTYEASVDVEGKVTATLSDERNEQISDESEYPPARRPGRGR